MKRTVLFVVATLASMLMVSTAFAQDDVKTKFYDFDDMLIDGEIKKPDGEVFAGAQAAKFERLVNLKKSFLPKIQRTAKSDALK